MAKAVTLKNSSNEEVYPVTDASLVNGLSSALSGLIDHIYPVGSIYMSTALTTAADVGAVLGGTWEAWGAGRFPVGVGVVDDNNDDWCGHTSAGDWTANPNGKGGETYHTLSIAEMPSHTHIQNAHGHRARYAVNMASGSGNHGPNSTGNNWKAANTWIENTTATNQNTGGGGAHNNMPPYITCYMYKRTA